MQRAIVWMISTSSQILTPSRRLGEEWGTAQSNWHARKVRVCKASQKHRINCSFMKLTAQTVKQCICCWFRMICR